MFSSKGSAKKVQCLSGIINPCKSCSDAMLKRQNIRGRLSIIRFENYLQKLTKYKILLKSTMYIY
eukprot:SAG11_NODE_18_length_25850_cov_18.210050_6_plen_65_part_00